MRCNIIILLIISTITFIGLYLRIHRITPSPFLKEEYDNEFFDNSTQHQSIIRFNNFASNECGAKVLHANDEAMEINNLLNSDKDSYYLSPCTDNIHFIIELCQAIQLKQIRIGNFELFSNQFERLNISCSVNGTHWIPLGEYTVPNKKTFHTIIVPQNWCRYIKVQQLSWYGKEYYCSITQFMAYGLSSLDELVEDMVEPEDIQISTNDVFEEMNGFTEINEQDIKFKGDILINELKNQYQLVSTKLSAEYQNNYNGINQDDSATSILQKQKNRMKTIENNMELMKTLVNELSTFLYNETTSIQQTEDKLDEMMNQLSMNLNINAEELRDIIVKLMKLEDDNKNLLKQNEQLERDIVYLKDTYKKLQQETDGRIKSMFIILGSITIILFIIIVYWIVMLWKQFHIVQSKKNFSVTSNNTSNSNSNTTQMKDSNTKSQFIGRNNKKSRSLSPRTPRTPKSKSGELKQKIIDTSNTNTITTTNNINSNNNNQNENKSKSDEKKKLKIQKISGFTSQLDNLVQSPRSPKQSSQSNQNQNQMPTQQNQIKTDQK